MTSPTSNRNIPEFTEYYQTLADIIGIFWQFHKERVESGNIDFAYMYDPDTFRLIPFDPQIKVDSWRKNNNFDTHKIIGNF